MDQKKQEIKTFLSRRKEKFLYFYPFLKGLVIPVLFTIGMSLQTLLWETPFLMVLVTAILGLIATIGYYLFFSKGSSINEVDIARDCDTQNQGQSRLETMILLDQQRHPLKGVQRQDTLQHYQNIPLKSGLPHNGIIIAIIALLALFQSSLLIKSLFHTQTQQKLSEPLSQTPISQAEKAPLELAELKEEEQPQEVAIESFSQLKLTHPNRDQEQSALDEVAWLGFAETTEGFSDLSMNLSINGEQPIDLPIDHPKLGAKGKLDLEGSVYLDEFDLEPFDIITYSLTGQLQIENRIATIKSLPQFIRIRHPRQEIFDSGDGGDGSTAEDIQLINEINRSIDEELAIIRDSTQAQTIQETRPEIAKPLITNVTQQQHNLMEGVQSLLSNVEKLDPKIYHHLFQASQYMEQATNILSETKSEKNHYISPEQWNQILREENKALSNLVKSLKDLKKILAKKGQKSKEQKRPDPSFDQQQYVIKPEDIPKNIGKQLQTLAKTQQEINQQSSSAPSSTEQTDNIAKKQEQVVDQLEDLLLHESFHPTVLKPLDEAFTATSKANQAIAQQNWDQLKNQGKSASSALKDALIAFRTEETKRMEESLDQAIKKMSQAKAQNTGNTQSGDSPETHLGKSKTHSTSKTNLQNSKELADQLESLAEVQREINQKNPSQLSKDQLRYLSTMEYRLTQRLKDLLQKKSLAPTVRNDLEKAFIEAYKAGNAIYKKDWKGLKRRGDLALYSLTNARSKIQSEYEKEIKESLDQAMKQRLHARTKSQEDREVENHEQQAINRLQEEYQRQKSKGMLENAQKLANLIKAIEQELAMQGLDPSQAGADYRSRMLALNKHSTIQKLLSQQKADDATTEQQLEKLQNRLGQNQRQLERKQLTGKGPATDEFLQNADIHLIDYQRMLKILLQRGQLTNKAYQEYNDKISGLSDTIYGGPVNPRKGIFHLIDINNSIGQDLQEIIKIVVKDPPIKWHPKEQVPHDYQPEITQYFNQNTTEESPK